MCRSPPGQCGTRLAIGAGFAWVICSASVAALVPVKAGWPVINSNSTEPVENRSDLPSTARPSACSGLM